MKALVIGGTGPTGPFVIKGLLGRGYNVTIFHRGTHEVDLPESVEHIHGDPHFMETLEQGLGQRTFDLVVSMYGRLRYLARVMKGRTDRFIGIGGLPYEILVTGDDAPGGIPVLIPETAPVFQDIERNKFLYLMAHSEQVVMEAHEEGYYKATMLRYPSLVYGPRQLGPKEWSIIRRILDGRKQIIVPDGGLSLDTRAYTGNAAQAVLLAVDKPEISAGQIYNVGDEKVMSLREWIHIIADTMDCELEFLSLPYAVTQPSYAYAGRGHHLVMDTTKIKTELAYQDLLPAEEALQRTVKWYLDNPLERNGDMEQRLGDPFDYTVEDKLIKAYREIVPELQELGSVGYQWRHIYDHPDKPETALDTKS